MRVLHISLDTAMGGIESFLLNVYNLIDRDKIQFDFIEYGDITRDFNPKFLNLGARIYNLPDRKKHPFLAQKELIELLRNNEYEVVHIHKNSLADIGSIRACQKASKSRIVLHSHNSSRDSKTVTLLHKINRRVLDLNGITKFSCSIKAAEWLYGTKEGVTIVKNGIDTNRFAFNSSKRQNIRTELSIDKYFVVGSVGRLTEQKNPLLMLDVMKKLQDENICLLWVGDGELRKAMEIRADEYGMRNRVIFTGAVPNPEDYYQAMDVFVMPSLYEGFPIAAVEAQCSGLQMILSSNITKEADIIGETKWVSIDSSLNWAQAIADFKEKKLIRKSNENELKMRGFDMKTTVDYLQNFYLNGDM